jgi:hypothetical protein
MNTAFREIRAFTESIAEYFGGYDSYFALQNALINNPECGVVIPGTGGLRKVRWPDPRRGKGKRGGLRVIYLHVPAARLIYFFDVYDKDEAEDISPAHKRVLSQLAVELRTELDKERGWYAR